LISKSKVLHHERAAVFAIEFQNGRPEKLYEIFAHSPSQTCTRYCNAILYVNRVIELSMTLEHHHCNLAAFAVDCVVVLRIMAELQANYMAG